MKKALITGITGQDGSYLAEFLLARGYEVHGIKRRSSSFNTGRIDHIYQDPHETDVALFLHYGDLTDGLNIQKLIRDIEPDEIYNLGAQSHVKVSFEAPEYTTEADALGTLRILEAVRSCGNAADTRIYQASSSELYGKVAETPQNEDTPFHPRSPYAVSKLYAYWIVRNYRESYGMYACNGILFNHESPRRGETFVTRKITRAAARISHGMQDVLYLGNLNAKRDWGFAGDYVEAMWRMLQQDVPKDYVVATGRMTSVREFARMAFGRAGMELEFRGSGRDEVGRDLRSGRVVVAVDPKYFRPAEVDELCGDASRALKELDWKSRVGVEELVDMMMEHDLAEAERDACLKKNGYPVLTNHE